MIVFVSGAGGFVGRPLVARLVHDGHQVRAMVRHPAALGQERVETILGDLADPAYAPHLNGTDVVVHLAARVHVLRDTADDPAEAFRRTNVEGTLRLAREAAARGVRRFVFVSSVKVNGEGGLAREGGAPAPEDAYGISKYEAERGLLALGAATGLEVVIVRPPLVYGPGVGANFGALMRAVRRGVPLPLGRVVNRRSLIAVDNLVDFLVTCVAHPAAANETFLVSDGEDVSTADLVVRLARAMHVRPRLLPIPPGLITTAARLTGRLPEARRLLGSLQVDTSKARTLLGWQPPITLEEGLRRAVGEVRQR
jgi:nucleoside-diphosphate-sugar epimerase